MILNELKLKGECRNIGGMIEMDKVERVKVVEELFDLINLYYVERDQPAKENNFFEKVENCCNLLDLDFNELKTVFNLNFGNDV